MKSIMQQIGESKTALMLLGWGVITLIAYWIAGHADANLVRWVASFAIGSIPFVIIAARNVYGIGESHGLREARGRVAGLQQGYGTRVDAGNDKRRAPALPINVALQQPNPTIIDNAPADETSMIDVSE